MAGTQRQSAHRTLKVKCGTWDQVEAFCTRKVRAGNRLPMRVPFTADPGTRLSLALELPSTLVVSIDGVVLECQPAPDGKKSAVVLELSGLTDALRTRLAELVADGRAGGSSGSIDLPPASAQDAPAPVPADVPVFELVPPPAEIDGSTVIDGERVVFDALEAEHKRLKESAAHEVLAVAWDADVDAVRAAYFGLTKQFHPDVYARYRSAPIRELAQEAFIHINRAYDRMRDAAVEAGSGIIAGPALLPHQGWMVADWSDIGEQKDAPSAAPLPDKRSTRAPSSPGIAIREPMSSPEPMSADTVGEPAAADSQPLTAASLGGVPVPVAADESAPVDADDTMVTARGMLEADDIDGARALLAKGLRQDPRNRSMRALYHVAAGRKLMAGDEGAKAIAQYEAALAHDRGCAEAREALEAARERAGGAGGKKAGLFKRLFR